MTKVRVDFNDRLPVDDLVPARVIDASELVSVGDQVLAYDNEGNLCAGVVTGLEDGWMTLAMRWNEFTTLEQLEGVGRTLV